MAMGIDQEIQRRMDAYRGNPQALQQRYQMSQQLLDLLALQKLKAEKDAVARQMQAQMQQQPGTVAQQMEQEMLGRTKQEMAQQVGGVLQQQARQQQQNMARMAQAAARPQGGLGSLAPQTAQPAPRMAGGGIVAFAQGGMTSPKDQINAIFSLLGEGKLNNREAVIQAALELDKARSEGELTDLRRTIFMNYAATSKNYPTQAAILPEDLKDKLLNFELGDSAFKTFGMPYDDRKPQTTQSAPRMAGGGIVAFSSGALIQPPSQYGAKPFSESPVAKGIEFLMDPFESGRKASLQKLQDRLARGERLSFAELDALAEYEKEFPGIQGPARPPAEVLASRKQADEAQDEAQTAPPPPPPEAVEVTERPPLKFTEVKAQTIDEPAGLAALRESLAAQAQEKPRDLKALMEEYGSALGQKERMERRQARIDELAALDRAQLDPERARKDRLMQVLAAAGGASNIGTMGARMANAAVSSRIRQEQDERARLRQRLAMADEMDTADLGISQEALKNALGTIDSIKTQRIQAMDALSNLARADVDRAEANAKAQYEADVQNNVYRAQEYEAARRAAEDVLDREDASIEQLLSVADQMRQVYDADLERRLALLGQDARYIELIDEAERTPEEELELQEMKDKAIADAAAYARMADYQGIMKQIEERTKQKFGFDFSR